MPASRPEDIRNLVLLGHGGSGKTTLGEAILFAAKATTRMGSVNDGTTVLDWSDIERDRKHSVDPALAFLEHEGKLLNLIDAPGYPDFIGGAICALAGADVGVLVVSASAGIEVNTRKLFKAAQDAHLPVAIVVNKIDAENLDLGRLLGELAESFGAACRPINLPTSGHKAVVDCLAGASGDSDLGGVEKAHTNLLESVVEADEALMESYLGGEAVSAEKLASAFAPAMVKGTVIPVFFTSAKEDIGVKELMDAVARYFPSPLQVPRPPVRSGEAADAAEVPLATDPAKPFVAQAFKITADPYVGKLAWVRILQGTAHPETAFLLRDEKKGTKIAHIFKVLGKETREVHEATAGDIIALAKIEGIEMGDVLHQEARPLFSTMPPMPTPMYSLAVTPKTRGDEQKISESLSRLAEEDPTFGTLRDSQTSETVISGIGDLHLRIMLAKMRQRFDLDVETKPPKIPYRETISTKADGHYRHKKQTGGAGQFGEVYLRVEPLPRGTGYQFESELFGESIPRQFLPAIEKGVQDIYHNGAIAGFPMQDIFIGITDGKHHPVDSKEIAFRTAGKYAFLDAVEKAKPVILEPIVNLEITIPQSFMGDIAGDLSGRRGRVLGQETLPGNMCVIQAQAPLAEVMQYNSQLRSVTGGQGSYAMTLSHYEPVPSHVQQQIVAAAVKAKQEDREK